MRKQISKICMLSFVLLGSISYLNAFDCSYSMLNTLHCKVESELALSLFHIYVAIEKSGEHNHALYSVVECVKNNCIDDIDTRDIQKMVLWMVQMLQQRSAVKAHSASNKPQSVYKDLPVYTDIEKFLIDCILSNADGYTINKQTKIACLSQLVVDSLESCEAQIFGDLTVDGQIINPCCQGSGSGDPVGPSGPTGVTGPIGPQGPPGTCCITSDYLFATYFSTGFVGTDGRIIENPINYLEVPANQEVVIPLASNPSLTDGWSDAIGSNAAFVVPEAGLYKISYEISLLLILYSNRLAVAWVERNNGSDSEQLLGSSVSCISGYHFTPQNLPTLRQTFLANLNANEEILLVLANKNTLLPFISLFVASGLDSSVAASLVITRVA